MIVGTNHAEEVREVCKHGVVSRKDFCFGTPIRVASAIQIEHASTMLLYMLGTAAIATKDAVLTFHDSLAQYPGLYRQKVKGDVRKATECCDRLRKEFLRMASIDGMGSAWESIVGRMVDDVAMDFTKLRFALRNEVGKYDQDLYCMRTDFLLAYEFSKQLVEEAESFGKFLHNDIGLGDSAELTQRLSIPIRGIRGYLSNLAGPILGDEVRKHSLDVMPVRNGFMAIWQKLLDWKAVERAMEKEALKERLNFSYDEDDVTAPEEYFDNGGTEWTETQDRILAKKYGRIPDGDLARLLGRTKAAIRARARKMGLRKKKQNG